MEWPVPAPVEGHGDPAQGLGHDDPVVVTPDFAAQADERFEAVCGELGILPARSIEPVAARVLPFGHEQVAMVQRLDAAAPIVAPWAVGVTPGRNALAAALPSAVAEGKVRAAVVFGDGDAPVRWGRADDEARLAALFAVVPHLGTFSATTGSDTYRVLRLPGIGVALVSEGASAATWVEGWFAALLHATQFALRTTPPSTDLVASPTADRTDDGGTGETSARVLEQLEDECRRILTAAQDQAREIRVAAERDAARAKERSQEKRSQEERSHEGRRRVSGRERGGDRTTRGEDPDDRRHLSDVRREIDQLLADAERARAALLADAQREADAARRQAELACAALVAETRTQCEALLKAARREAKSMRRDAKKLRRDAARALAQAPRGTESTSRRDERVTDVLSGARRTADELLHDARRAADDLLRDAARLRQQLLDDASRRTADLQVEHRTAGPASSFDSAPAPEGVATDASVTPATSATDEEARLAALALLNAAAESVATMSSLLGRLGAERPGASGDPTKDLPGLYFGA